MRLMTTVFPQGQGTSSPVKRPALPANVFAIPTTPPATVFRGENAPSAPKPLKAPPLFLRPIISIMATFYTRPKLSKRFFPGSQSLLDPEHLHLFQPIQPVSFKSLDKIPLQGYWMPADKPSTKTVILGHGYTADWRELIAVAEPLQEKGYNCFLFDFRAHGASGGKKTSIGFHEGKDISAAVNTVKEQFKAQSEKLFYLGHSMGSAAMMMAPKSLEAFPEDLEKLNTALNGIILDAPYYSFREIAERFIKGVSSVDPTNWLARNVAGPILKGKMGDRILNGLQWKVKSYLKLPVDLFSLVPAQILADSKLGKKPTLVLHGDQDFVTPYDHGVRVFQTLKAKNPNTLMATLVGAEHLNRKWDPASKNEAFWTSQRSTLRHHVSAFLNNISFQGLGAWKKKAS